MCSAALCGAKTQLRLIIVSGAACMRSKLLCCVAAGPRPLPRHIWEASNLGERPQHTPLLF
jgi:hypothetical protein